MSYEAARFVCGEPGCDARFLSKLALQGHQSMHAENTAEEVRHAH